MIAATAAELRAIAVGATDASGYFAAMYARVTGQIAASIDAGEFEDGPRMDRFASTFAGLYAGALREERPRPRCWEAAFDVAGDRELLIVQHLLLGINAHVNHDLALAVVEVAMASGEPLSVVRRDFDAVNDVLAGVYSVLLRDLDRVSRWANQAARLGGGRLFNFSLRAARAQAWQAAERLHALDSDAAREGYRAELDRLVTVLAYLITRPMLVTVPLVRLARLLEEDDPAVVSRALLGASGG